MDIRKRFALPLAIIGPVAISLSGGLLRAPTVPDVGELYGLLARRAPLSLRIVPERNAIDGVSLTGTLELDTRVRPPVMMLSWTWEKTQDRDLPLNIQKPTVDDRGPASGKEHRSGYDFEVLNHLDFAPTYMAAWDASHVLVAGEREGEAVTQAWTIRSRVEDGSPRLTYEANESQMHGISQAVGFITGAFRLDIAPDEDTEVEAAGSDPLVENRLMLVQNWQSGKLYMVCLLSGGAELRAVPSCDALQGAEREQCAGADGPGIGTIRIVKELDREHGYSFAMEHALHREFGYTYVFRSEAGDSGTFLVLWDQNGNGTFTDEVDGARLYSRDDWYGAGMHLAKNYLLPDQPRTAVVAEGHQRR